MKIDQEKIDTILEAFAPLGHLADHNLALEACKAMVAWFDCEDGNTHGWRELCEKHDIKPSDAKRMRWHVQLDLCQKTEDLARAAIEEAVK